jgi:succinate dehydrogenase / fumarate reductase, flavoprotein subunit
LFFDGNWYPENPVPYILQLKHLIKQVKANNARLDGGYYSSYRHVKPEVLEKYFYQTQFAKKIDIDLSKELYENAVTWHMNVGGVYTKGKTMESGVPGLLIAGSVSSLITGGIMNVMYEGIVAAKTAVELVAKRTEYLPLEKEQLDEEKSRVLGLFVTDPKEGLLPGQIKKKIRTVMWEHHNYIKTAETMERAYSELQLIEEKDIPQMRLRELTQNYNCDWVDAMDAIDMLQALKTAIQFSMYRKESRGAFYRDDYPLTDNTNWLVHVMGEKDSNGDLKIEKRPVDLPYVRPKEEIVSFFDVDY